MSTQIDRIFEPVRRGLEDRYHNFESNFPSPFWAEFFLIIFSSIVVYWIVGLFYYIVDNHKGVFLKYKIQQNAEFDYKNDTGKLVRQVLYNHAIQASLSFVILYFVKYRSGSVQPRMPTPSRFVLEMIVIILVREAGFYYSHRLLHHPLFYKRIHKMHHEYTAPIAWTAAYCHPIEHIISNSLPVTLGPAIMGSHSAVIAIWTTSVIFHTLSVHSGYNFPGNLFMPPVFHDFHHLKFEGNFGFCGLLDWFHGTDRVFRASKYYAMNRRYFSLTPPKEFHYVNGKMN